MPLPLDERYQVRNEDVERALRTLATQIDGEVPDGFGWALIIAPFGEHEAAPKGQGAVFYISSAARAGMLDNIQAWIDLNRSGKR
jgi:hypothetical protein